MEENRIPLDAAWTTELRPAASEQSKACYNFDVEF